MRRAAIPGPAIMTDRAVITVADDFGLSPAVNEAVERAHREGILTSASLMVAADHAADAIARARSLPGLRVGLHLVAVEGPAALPAADLPDLVGPDGGFPAAQIRLALRYATSPRARRQLAREIRAQFEAFRRTGLTLDHANAHKHMHLHPLVGHLMIETGREYGLRAIRIPREAGGGALGAWCRVLRAQARRAGLRTNDWIAGLADTGHMTLERVQHHLAHLRPGVTELYFHPATETDAILRRRMPDYAHAAELDALLRARVPQGVRLTTYT